MHDQMGFCSLRGGNVPLLEYIKGMDANEEKKIDKDINFDNFRLYNSEEGNVKKEDVRKNKINYNGRDDISDGENDIFVQGNDILEVRDYQNLAKEDEELLASFSKVPTFSSVKDNTEALATELWEKGKRKNNKINKKLLDIVILKNILNIYFLFDKNNEGYINQKYACHVIQMIYENDIPFMLESVMLNGEEFHKGNMDPCGKVFDVLRRRGGEEGQGFFCTKKFANFLLVLLLDISTFQKGDGFIKREFFIHVISEFLQTSSPHSTNGVYGMLRYPQNIVTKFYSYVHHLKRLNDEEEKRIFQKKKKKKKLKNIYTLDDKLVNADLNTHIKHFKEKTKKKLERVKTDVEKAEMTECTFSPYTTKKPLYLIRKKLENNLSKLLIEKETKSKYAPIRITYDIDNSIERTLLLPNQVCSEEVSPNVDKLNNEHHSYEDIIGQSIELKYIIHQGYTQPRKISWNDSLRSRRVIPLDELYNRESRDVTLSTRRNEEKKKKCSALFT
ncbi:conserved Plasmodium protein, unknown function [Plasmodium ovale curtisi]|uniref:Uncharacterized protein n=1 Tax=Plasmodium ovale curtisi TaxID=864141 RepID=A0A1A8W3C5_PLAOA|nr:conserved Plasmodium protein, unknown function [Plasmodium ovale curtisi]SBS95716.1 conserved Plasmodium protein, unknown function [Plasmodium ovale curtisi]